MAHTYRSIAARHVRWYREHGRYPSSRIKLDAHGVEYVIGDWAWNRLHREAPELIEPAMKSQERA